MSVVDRPLEPFEQRLTVEAAHRNIGKWVRVLPGFDLAIIIKVIGTGVLVRFAGDVGRRNQHTHYASCSLDSLLLRTDCDGRPLPNWLQQALEASRAGKRVAPELSLVVHRILTGSVDDPHEDVVYETFKRERGLLTGPVDQARFVRIFENGERLEARYREEQELAAELDQAVARDRQEAE